MDSVAARLTTLRDNWRFFAWHTGCKPTHVTLEAARVNHDHA
jgi:hypothetical protein